MISIKLASLGFLALAAARDCRPDDASYDIHSQDQLDELSNDCTTINGGIRILNNYTGSFVLNNVVNITSLRAEDPTDDNDNPNSELTSIELPDLQYVNRLLDIQTRPVTRLSLPRLRSVNESLHVAIRDEGEVRLPALSEAGDITVEGNITRVHLDTLETAANLRFTSPFTTGLDSMTVELPPLSVSLPALNQVSSLIVEGNITEINAPELTTITGPQNTTQSDSLGLYSSELSPASASAGSGAPISFPRLSHIEGNVRIGGNIESMSFPELQEVTRDLTVEITSANQLTLDFPIRSARIIVFSGPFESIQFPNLENYNDLGIWSTVGSFDCDEFEERLDSSNVESGELQCKASLGVSLQGRGVGTGVTLGITLGVIGIMEGLS
ncbi:uncharacterized protein BDV14DRAFT_165935 [Aspergillus stella-maris]|uniref:uncharacterized protein n=1 Tax=Aspergillus stella-maris TaxID=1810926 RepID=UPI003CCCD693